MVDQIDPLCDFSEIVFSRERESVVLIFKIIKNYIFLETFIEIYQVVQKIWRFSTSVLAIFYNFFDFWKKAKKNEKGIIISLFSKNIKKASTKLKRTLVFCIFTNPEIWNNPVKCPVEVDKIFIVNFVNQNSKQNLQSLTGHDGNQIDVVKNSC